MAIGDDAIAAGMDVVAGTVPANTLDTEVNKTRDYIAQRTSAVTPVDRGGTGAATPAGARSNLDVPSIADLGGKLDRTALAPGDQAVPGRVPTYNGAGQLASNAPTLGGHVVPLSTLQGGFTTYGDVYLPNARPATAGYTIAYLNNDGRVSKGASSRRYKERITDVDPAELGDVFPQLVRYRMIDGDGSWMYGYIAEDLAESDDLERFVVYQVTPDGEQLVLDEDGQPQPDSIDFIQLLLVQVAQLHARLAALEAQVSG